MGVPMDDDKQLLKGWLEDGDWGDYLETHGALEANVSTWKFKAVEKQYFDNISARIAYCQKLLVSQQDAFIYYTLAVLYSRCNLDSSASFLYKVKTRYYCFKSIRKDPGFAAAWGLLAESYSWIAVLSESKKESIGYIENAVHCINMALKSDHLNAKYRNLSKSYYYQRNECFR